jgi:DNA-binding NarL/FixJ family response regulator
VERIKVGVFDDDEIFRRGVVACLGDDEVLEVVAAGSSSSSAEAGDVLDVAVVAPSVLDRWRPRCRVVVCAGGTAGAAAVPRAVAPAVMAILSRQTVVPDQLVNAVRAAAVGLRIADTGGATSDLDERSVQVLRMLADGADTREISGTLGWSERTIKGVIATIQQELGARSRTEAVAVALRRQVI